MPNIKPISNSRNHTEVLNEVEKVSPIYLTRNGRGECAIVQPKEYDKLKATVRLLAKLEEGEKSAREKGWLSADGVEDGRKIIVTLKEAEGNVIVREDFDPEAENTHEHQQ